MNPQNKLPYGIASARQLYRKYKQKAVEYNRTFDIPFEDFMRITSQICYLCGRPPAQTVKNKYNSNGHYIYNGLDRVDNSIGYTISNVLPCCKYCNSMKSNHSLEEFKKMIKQILKYHGE